MEPIQSVTPPKRKRTLADFWSLIFVAGFLLMWHFANIEPEEWIATWYMRIAWFSLTCFVVAILWSKWKLKEFFSNLSGGR